MVKGGLGNFLRNKKFSGIIAEDSAKAEKLKRICEKFIDKEEELNDIVEEFVEAFEAVDGVDDSDFAKAKEEYDEAVEELVNMMRVLINSLDFEE